MTGGNGYIGRALVTALRSSSSYECVVVYDIGLCAEHNVNNGAALEELLGEHQIDTVYHLASQVEYRSCPDEETIWRINVDGTRTVIEACRKSATVKRLVYLGSVEAIYGLMPHPHLDLPEESLSYPKSFWLAGVYGRTKATAEQMVLKADDDSLRTVVARTGHVVGRDDANHVNPPYIVAKQMWGFLPVFYVFGDQPCQQLIHVEDAARGLVFIAEHLEDFHGAHVSLAGDPDLGWRVSLIMDWSAQVFRRHMQCRFVHVPFWPAFLLAWILEWTLWGFFMLTGMRIRSPFTRTAIHGTGMTATYNVDKLKKAGFKFKWSFKDAVADARSVWEPPRE